jgi:hypothetical protein
MSRPTEKKEPRMEVEGIEKATNEGQIILLGKDIEEEDKGKMKRLKHPTMRV